MQQLRCPNCGTPYNPGDAFCGECGHALPPATAPANEYGPAPTAAEPAPPAYNQAPTAAELGQPEIHYSAPVTPTPGPAPRPTPPARVGVNPLLIGGGVAALLVLLLGVFVLPGLLGGRPSPTPTALATVPATATAPLIVAETPQPTSTTADFATPTIAAVLPTATQEAIATALPSPTGPAQLPTAATFRLEAEPGILDPQYASNVVDVGVLKLLFEPLLTLNDKLAPVPAAAESWNVSADGLIWTLKVRSGLTFSDGTPITASDFEYAWKRLLDPSKYSVYASLAYVLAGAADYNQSTSSDAQELQTLRDAVGVKAVDAATIVFTLRQPASYFPYLLTLPVGAPVKRDVVEQNFTWDQSAETLIGNGPYLLQEWQSGVKMVFAANPRYHGTAPHVAQLQAVIIRDDGAALAAYRAGQLDWMLIAPEGLDTVDVDAALKADLARGDGSCTTFIDFNTYRAPFKNADVRRAYVQAADRQNWSDVRLGGVKPAYSLIPPGQPGYQGDLNPLPYSPDAARALLAKANVSGAKSIEVEYVPVNAATNQGGAIAWKQLLDWLKNQLAEHLGVELKLKAVTQQQYDDLFNDNNTKPLLYSDGWCQDYPDPQNWLTTLFNSNTGQVTNGWQNNAFDGDVDEADREPDQGKRIQLYNRAQTILVYEAPVLFTEWSENIWLIKPQWQVLRDHLNSQDLRIPGYTYLLSATQ